jgi:hypothetical protein
MYTMWGRMNGRYDHKKLEATAARAKAQNTQIEVMAMG